MINYPYSYPHTSASQQNIFQMYNPISKLGDRSDNSWHKVSSYNIDKKLMFSLNILR